MIQRVLASLVILLSCWSTVSAAEQTIVVLGDSLSSGYGLGTDRSWVAILEDRLAAEAYEYTLVNASIAGDTSSGGLARLPQLLELHEPAIVIIELGGNDGLRGQPVARLRENLGRIIDLVREAGARPLLTGIQIPPNYGLAYTEQFAAVYEHLAHEYGVPIVGFLMDGVALKPELMQGDRIHPNADGQGPMAENVWSVLRDLL
jgi:acyl-CoA thioesterase-1